MRPRLHKLVALAQVVALAGTLAPPGFGFSGTNNVPIASQPNVTDQALILLLRNFPRSLNKRPTADLYRRGAAALLAATMSAGLIAQLCAQNRTPVLDTAGDDADKMNLIVLTREGNEISDWPNKLAFLVKEKGENGIPWLRRLQTDRSEEVRAAADKALALIHPSHLEAVRSLSLIDSRYVPEAQRLAAIRGLGNVQYLKTDEVAAASTLSSLLRLSGSAGEISDEKSRLGRENRPAERDAARDAALRLLEQLQDKEAFLDLADALIEDWLDRSLALPKSAADWQYQAAQTFYHLLDRHWLTFGPQVAWTDLSFLVEEKARTSEGLRRDLCKALLSVGEPSRTSRRAVKPIPAPTSPVGGGHLPHGMIYLLLVVGGAATLFFFRRPLEDFGSILHVQRNVNGPSRPWILSQEALDRSARETHYRGLLQEPALYHPQTEEQFASFIELLKSGEALPPEWIDGLIGTAEWSTSLEMRLRAIEHFPVLLGRAHPDKRSLAKRLEGVLLAMSKSDIDRPLWRAIPSILAKVSVLLAAGFLSWVAFSNVSQRALEFYGSSSGLNLAAMGGYGELWGVDPVPSQPPAVVKASA